MDQLLDKITLADLIKSDDAPARKLEQILDQNMVKP
jgi:hypothetical protein